MLHTNNPTIRHNTGLLNLAEEPRTFLKHAK